jgi:hypothetical protein
VLERGNYETPGAEVAPAVPAALPPLPADAKADRLGLARWLVAPEHPLFARVAVNRFWQKLFGRGLVNSPEDFGLQSELPSHPELLDWLAVEFRESGWDVKRLLKLIVTSATYRQSAAVPAAFHDRDPDNMWLARGPRFRLDSRTLRDQALFISGLLVEKSGGFPVMPYQPPGIWEEMSFGKNRYFQGREEDLYRRSLYTFWRRSVAPGNFFDVPARQVCSVKPLRTSTPLHVLTTLNDPTYVEAARVMAAGVIKDHADDRVRVTEAFARVLGRFPEAEEGRMVTELLANQRARYGVNPDDAAKLVAVGESRAGGDIDAVELAAWTLTVHTLMNLDEAITRR